MTGTRTALPLRVIHRGWNTFGIATLTQPDGSTVPRALEDHGEAACVLPDESERRVALLGRQSRVGPAAQIARDEAPGLLGEIQQDRARFEQRNRRAAVGRLVVDDRRHAVVRGDLEKVRVELFAFTDVDRLDPIRNAGLLEEHRDLVAVRRRPIVQIDHRIVSR